MCLPGASNSNANNAEAGMRCLVVGAPRVGGARWSAAHAQLKEAELVADMLRVTPLTDYQVRTKPDLVRFFTRNSILS